MSTSWNKNSLPKFQNNISITQRDIAYNVQAIQKPKEKQENLNFWAQIGIMVGSMVLSSVAGAGTLGVLSGVAISYTRKLIISNTVSFAIDLGTQVGLDIGMNRFGKSKQFLTMMPIFGMEWLGKTYAIHKVSKNVNSMTKSLQALDLVDAMGNTKKVPQALINDIKINPLPYIQKFQKNSNVKVSYKKTVPYVKEKGSNKYGGYINIYTDPRSKKWVRNHFNQRQIKEMEYLRGQRKSQEHFYNNMLRKDFADESIFNTRIYNKKDFDYMKSKGMSSNQYDVSKQMWEDGSEHMYRKVSKTIVDARSKFLPEFRINRSRAKWSIGEVKAKDKLGFKQKKTLSNKWNHWIKGNNPRVAGQKGNLAKTTSQNLAMIDDAYVFDTQVVKGFDRVFSDEIIAEKILEKQAQSKNSFLINTRNQTRSIQNWAKYGRYTNPMLAIKKAGRWTGDIVSDIGIKIDRTIAKNKVSSLQKAGKLKIYNPNQTSKIEEQLKPYLIGTKLKKVSNKFKNPLAREIKESGLTELDRRVIGGLSSFTKVKSRWILTMIMAKDIANMKTPLPAFISFVPSRTTGTNKNRFGKRPVWSQPMTQDDIKLFLEDAGRFYLQRIAYGYGYSNELEVLKYTLPIAPLPVQGIFYSGYRTYTATIGIKRAIKNLQNIASLDYGKLLVEGFVPTMLRSIGRRSGFGMITTNFIRNDIFTNGVDIGRGFQTFSTRKVSVMRRRNMRDKPVFVANKRRK